MRLSILEYITDSDEYSCRGRMHATMPIIAVQIARPLLTLFAVREDSTYNSK